MSGWLLRRSDQAPLAVTAAFLLASIGIYWNSQGGFQGRQIDIEQAPPLQAQFQLDPNHADWVEFAQLPGIGETLGRRIVEERTAGGPFLDHDDLRHRVHGIGPRTLDAMRPYLRPMPPGADVAGG